MGLSNVHAFKPRDSDEWFIESAHVWLVRPEYSDRVTADEAAVYYAEKARRRSEEEIERLRTRGISSVNCNLRSQGTPQAVALYT